MKCPKLEFNYSNIIGGYLTMAKLSFTKLGLAQNKAVINLNYNGQVVEVKQYLPVNDKLALISSVINLSADENNFANPMKVSVYSVLEIIKHYTNISFTEKQMEDPCKIYDLFVGNGLSSMVLNAIPEVELAELLTGIEDSINAVYSYRNSVMGVLDVVQSDYDGMNLDARNIQQAISDPENLALLKNVMTKLG
jgi:hypothetical protein